MWVGMLINYEIQFWQLLTPFQTHSSYWLNYWHILILKGTIGLTSNTSLISIQYCYQFSIYMTDLPTTFSLAQLEGQPPSLTVLHNL